jgi:DNA-binding NtrC family response regulator
LVLPSRTGTLDPIQIIGRSPSITRLKARIPHLSAAIEPLVIFGETGTGKALLAKAIHARSPRRSLEIHSVNFSVLSEREQRGALLGGVPPELPTNRRGCLEPPSTVVIKHIDHANPFLQEKLAAALTKKKIFRLGADTWNLVLARPIFTLRQSLLSLHRKGQIIEALFIQLRLYEQISVPPLRKRKEDIPLLVYHFLNESLDGRNLPSLEQAQVTRDIIRGGTIEAGLLKLLKQQRWDQNVLQLKAYIRSLLLPNHRDSIQEREKIELMRMIALIEEGNEFSLHQSLALIQRCIVDRALAKCNGRQSQAAALLGLTDRSIRR